MGKVRTTKQLKAKTSSMKTRSTVPNTGKIGKPVNAMKSEGLNKKKPGTGLDDYSLDVMRLE